jgi:integrase
VLDYCDERAGNSIRGQQWWLFKQFIIWQIDTGMRKSESLLVDEARIVNNRVRLYEGETKNEDAREIPLTSRLVKLVETFKAMGLNGPFFGSLSHSKIFEMWNEARAKLNLGDVTIHDLRHTRGQRLYDAGVPLEVISELLGHRDISVTAQVYTKRKAATLDKWTRHAEENPGAALRLVS